ncbi:replication protein RepA [Spirosoma pomorum]
MESKKEPKKISDRKLKAFQNGVKIATDKATIKNAVFQHSVLCQTFLPTRDPGDEVREWEQKQGNVSLLVQAGKAINQEGHFENVGLPHGTKARLILAHINSQAIKTQSKIIDVEDSMSAFIKRIGLNTDGYSIREVKEQLRRLSTARLSMGYSDGVRGAQFELQIVSAFDLWFPKDERQRVLWPSSVQLSGDYFQSLLEHAIPLDERALGALAHNTMALDMYAWLAQRLHRIEKGDYQFVSWVNLWEQFGQNYTRIRDFRRDFRKTLQSVIMQYPFAKIEEVADKGLNLFHSPPPIEKKIIMQIPISVGEQKEQEAQSS